MKYKSAVLSEILRNSEILWPTPHAEILVAICTFCHRYRFPIRFEGVIAAQGPHNSLNFYWNNDGDATWNPSVIAGPGTTFSPPALGRVENESTIIVVRGLSQLLFYWNNDGDSTWNSSVIATL